MDCPVITRRIAADFALIDEALAVGVDVLNGVFDRDDVFFVGSIEVIDHRGEGRRFARPRRSGDEDEAARQFGKLAQDRGQRQFFERAYFVWNVAKRPCHRSALYEDVSAETSDVFDTERKIELIFGVKSLALFVVE